MTLTSKFQGQIINCLCLKNAWPDLHETKGSVNRFVDLFHILPWPLNLPVTLTMNFQGQILKLTYLWNIGPYRKKWNKIGWILLMVWYCVNNMTYVLLSSYAAVPYRRDVSVVLSLVISLWAYPCRNGDGVYLGHKTCWGAVFVFTPYTHRSCMKFAIFLGNKDTNMV